MRTNLYLNSIFFICVALFFSTCKKDNTPSRKGYYFLYQCETVGIDIEGPEGTGGGSAWQGHANAITAINYCLIADKQLSVGNVITFGVSNTNIEPGSNCPYQECLVAVPGPPNRVYIISKNYK